MTNEETTMHYRAKLVLEEVEPTVDGNGHQRDRTSTIAAVDVTAGSPGSAMVQMLEHARALSGWHTDTTQAQR